jgi:hypothetical protein
MLPAESQKPRKHKRFLAHCADIYGINNNAPLMGASYEKF